MMSLTEVADYTGRVLLAYHGENRDSLRRLVGALIDGPRNDIASVTLTMAAAVMEGVPLPECGFFKLDVVGVCPDGHMHERSAADLPAGRRAYSQIVVALGNRDRPMALDLYCGYVGDDGLRATELLTLAIPPAAQRLFGGGSW